MIKKFNSDFFNIDKNEAAGKNAPLSSRMRPRSLEDFIGQEHILGPGKLLRRIIDSDKLTCVIFYGPPGVGKTSLAYCISCQTKSYFEKLNAVSANLKDLRQIINSACLRAKQTGRKTILFLDEIHHFNKSQQDVLNPVLEEHQLILIGATVLNPFFSLNAPLVSRSAIFCLNPLSEKEIGSILNRAIVDKQRGLGFLNINICLEALSFLAKVSEGDARKALNALEVAALSTVADKNGRVLLGLKEIEESIQKKALNYDKDGDSHYDTISAFIKSMRGSDPDATLYWLAKMIYAGEDPRFIARRICICASEDVGNAEPQAMVIAGAAYQSVEMVGMPEARIILAQAAVFIACAPKSNAAYKGIESALSDIEKERTQAIPDHLKDSSYKGAKALGHGQGYKYSHDFESHYCDQSYMNENKRYYIPSEMGYEAKIKRWLSNLKREKNDNKQTEAD